MQLIEESDDDGEILTNIRGNNSTDNLSEPDNEIEAVEVLIIILGMLFILPLELISILF